MSENCDFSLSSGILSSKYNSHNPPSEWLEQQVGNLQLHRKSQVNGNYNITWSCILWYTRKKRRNIIEDGLFELADQTGSDYQTAHQETELERKKLRRLENSQMHVSHYKVANTNRVRAQLAINRLSTLEHLTPSLLAVEVWLAKSPEEVACIVVGVDVAAVSVMVTGKYIVDTSVIVTVDIPVYWPAPEPSIVEVQVAAAEFARLHLI